MNVFRAADADACTVAPGNGMGSSAL